MKSLDSLVCGGKDTDGLFRLVRSEEADNCDLFKFLCNVSRKNVDGSWVVDESELLNKLCAIGYLLHPIKYRQSEGCPFCFCSNAHKNRMGPNCMVGNSHSYLCLSVP